MPPPLKSSTGFADLHTLARRASRRAEEADDLLQSALLAAIEAGRTDFASPKTRRWLAGVIRNRGAFEARTAARRRQRESAFAAPDTTEDRQPTTQVKQLDALPPALRVTALLALNGCTRTEIGWLLGLSDVALRQRISQLRRALDRAGLSAPGEPQLSGSLDFGRIRAALLAAARRGDAFVASHDPDGHLFVVSRSQIDRLRQQTGE
jgi:DNA-directed RNA polymerase specialized sigma24 family protein